MRISALLKQLFVFAPACLLFHTSFSQRFTYSPTNLNLESYFFNVDSAISKNKKKIKETWYCFNGISDSCYIEQISRYDDSGRVVEHAAWEFPENKELTFTARFKKISAFQFEGIIKYPQMLVKPPDPVYADTLTRRIIYNLDSFGGIDSKYSYDMDNKLVHRDSGPGRRILTGVSRDTIVTASDSTIIKVWTYDEYEYSLTIVYDRTGRVIHTTESTLFLISEGGQSIERTTWIYGDNNRPAIVTTVDKYNKLRSVSRCYYEQGVFVRSTMDKDTTDSIIDEERRYNPTGDLIQLTTSDPVYGMKIWKYYYSDSGLLEKEEHFRDSLMMYSRKYIYK
jgi:hypothetical protein